MSPDEATRSLLGALVARRDAKRMIDIGFRAATDEARKVLNSIDKEHCEVTRIAAELIDLYDVDPADYPEGATAASALASAEGRIAETRKGRR